MSADQARMVLALALALILGAAYFIYWHYPISVLSGENSVGTWLSGFLLAACAAFCLVLALRRGPVPWLFFMVFFIGLALDERFMFHEQLKEYILFSSPAPKPHPSAGPAYVGEIPVLLAALLGAVVASFIWRCVKPRNRVYLLLAAALGSLSVGLDVNNVFLVLEDSAKVLGEFCIACCLLGEVGNA